ncbi:hypothetical protein [Streptomyces sp. NPDC006463]|uniref:hypothetical protein n=1 Tax=Streptomyces sp. NPDC006463 TaxID=3364746 RepID=UPI0036A1BFB9
MDRALKALGAAHVGAVGVLLADGSEPGPVYFDVGSGPNMPSSTEWHAYDGRRGRPRGAVLRGSCSCGWRGAAEYPLDWTALPGNEPLYEADVDLSGPIADYEAHLSVIRDGTVPLSAKLTELLTDLVCQLDGLAIKEPLVALKALADLRYVIAQTGQEAAYELGARDVPLKEVATALGTSDVENAEQAQALTVVPRELGDGDLRRALQGPAHLRRRGMGRGQETRWSGRGLDLPRRRPVHRGLRSRSP